MPSKDKNKRKEANKRFHEKNPNYDKIRYQKNKEYFASNKKERKAIKREWLKDYKSKQSCKLCGESDPVCLDFHHVNPSKKVNVISKLINDGYSLDNIKKEVEKCIILCANCHRKIHRDHYSL